MWFYRQLHTIKHQGDRGPTKRWVRFSGFQLWSQTLAAWGKSSIGETELKTILPPTWLPFQLTSSSELFLLMGRLDIPTRGEGIEVNTEYTATRLSCPPVIPSHGPPALLTPKASLSSSQEADCAQGQPQTSPRAPPPSVPPCAPLLSAMDIVLVAIQHAPWRQELWKWSINTYAFM